VLFAEHRKFTSRRPVQPLSRYRPNHFILSHGDSVRLRDCPAPVSSWRDHLIINLQVSRIGMEKRAADYKMEDRFLTDADAWAVIRLEEETESLGEVRSQRRRCLPFVDE